MAAEVRSAHADATEHATQMGFHRRLADAEPAADLFVGQTGGGQRQDFGLAIAEQTAGIRGARRQQEPGDPRVERGVTGGRGPHRGQQIPRRTVLEQIPDGARQLRTAWTCDRSEKDVNAMTARSGSLAMQ